MSRRAASDVLPKDPNAPLNVALNLPPEFDALLAYPYRPEFWSLNQELPADQKVVLILVTFLGDRPELARLCGLTEEATRAAVAELDRSGVLRNLRRLEYVQGSGQGKDRLPGDIFDRNVVQPRYAA